MELSRTGGGLIHSGRSKPDSDLPMARSIKPMRAPTPAQGASTGQAPQSAPQGAQPPMPQQAPPQPAQAPMPAQGMLGPAGGQPMPQGGAGAMPGEDMGAPGGVNDVASNALRILHDDNASQRFDDMISQGPVVAGQVAEIIYSQVMQLHSQNGSPVNEDNAAQAIDEITQDIADIGLSMGSFPAEPLVGGVPASVYEFQMEAFRRIGEMDPNIKAAIEQMSTEATPEQHEQGKSVVDYMQQRYADPEAGQAPQGAPQGQGMIGPAGGQPMPQGQPPQGVQGMLG